MKRLTERSEIDEKHKNEIGNGKLILDRILFQIEHYLIYTLYQEHKPK